MNLVTVTLSSVGTSDPVNLDWRGGKYISALATLGSTSMTCDFTIQYTLNDSQMFASTSRVWTGIGSSVGSSITHFSSAIADSGVSAMFLSPVAGLRISSSAISASNITLRVLQGDGG